MWQFTVECKAIDTCEVLRRDVFAELLRRCNSEHLREILTNESELRFTVPSVASDPLRNSSLISYSERIATEIPPVCVTDTPEVDRVTVRSRKRSGDVTDIPMLKAPSDSVLVERALRSDAVTIFDKEITKVLSGASCSPHPWWKPSGVTGDVDIIFDQRGPSTRLSDWSCQIVAEDARGVRITTTTAIVPRPSAKTSSSMVALRHYVTPYAEIALEECKAIPFGTSTATFKISVTKLEYLDADFKTYVLVTPTTLIQATGRWTAALRATVRIEAERFERAPYPVAQEKSTGFDALRLLPGQSPSTIEKFAEQNGADTVEKLSSGVFDDNAGFLSKLIVGAVMDHAARVH